MAVVLGAGAVLQSCTTMGLLEADVRAMNHDTRIFGSVTDRAAGPVKVLVLKRSGGGGLAVADSTTPNAMGDFAFLMPPTEPYFVAAVSSRGKNSWSGAEDMISLYGGDRLKEIPIGKSPETEKIRIDMDRANPAAGPLRKVLEKWNPEEAGKGGAVPIACGEIRSLDDPAFDEEAGIKGMWQPLTAAKRHGLGIHFLQPYDPGKVPVIFVHGIMGTPRNWKPVIAGLDRSRFQPWIFDYPSGIPLENAANALADLTDRLHRHYRFKKLHVVAHSMGGLPARRAVQLIRNKYRADYLSSLTTISTPWSGSPFAVIGTIGMPAAVPCWFDLRPGSPFLKKTLGDPLPVPHLMVTTEKSKFKITLPRRNDGTVSVASQRDPRAVAKASDTLLVHEDHMAVLEAAETREALDDFLKKR